VSQRKVSPGKVSEGKASDGNSRKRGSNAKRRRGARQKAMQALYQWDFDQAANDPAQVIRQFCEMQNMEKVDVDYFESLFTYSVENVAAIDAEISLHLDRELEQVDPIERSVLRICCAELKTELGTPYKVVVNEAVEISKDFGADLGFRYINGIADKLAASLRDAEYKHDHPSGNPQSQQSTEKESRHRKPASSVKVSVKEKTEQPLRSGVRKSPSAEKKSSSPKETSPRKSPADSPDNGSDNGRAKPELKEDSAPVGKVTSKKSELAKPPADDKSGKFKKSS